MGISAADIYPVATCYPYFFLFLPISSYSFLSLPIQSYLFLPPHNYLLILQIIPIFAYLY